MISRWRSTSCVMATTRISVMTTISVTVPVLPARLRWCLFGTTRSEEYRMVDVHTHLDQDREILPCGKFGFFKRNGITLPAWNESFLEWMVSSYWTEFTIGEVFLFWGCDDKWRRARVCILVVSNAKFQVCTNGMVPHHWIGRMKWFPDWPKSEKERQF